MSAGQVHDLGYKRYVGTRRDVGTRWRVIMRHQITTGWTGWWRFKIWLLTGSVTTAIIAGILYFARAEVFRRVGSIGGVVLTYADGLLPDAPRWLSISAFVISLTISSTVVAGDIASGAFTFYFARSVRPRDYVLGKLAGVAVLVSFIMLLGPIALAIVRLGLSEDTDQLIAVLPILPKAILIGVIGTLVYTAVPLGFSALVANRRYAIGLWAIYYVPVSWAAVGIGYAIHPDIAAIDLTTALHAFSLHLFGLQTRTLRTEPSTAAALISLLGHVALAIGVMVWRVRNAQRTGVGGAS